MHQNFARCASLFFDFVRVAKRVYRVLDGPGTSAYAASPATEFGTRNASLWILHAR